MRYVSSINDGFRCGRLAALLFAAAILGASAFPASGQVHVWSRGLGDTETIYCFGVAADASGNAYVTGRFFGTVDLGGGPLTSQGSTDIYLAKYDAGGNHVWSKSLGGSQADSGVGVGVDASGDVYLTGGFQRDVDFGGGTLTSASPDEIDIFLAKYDSDGNHLWSNRYGDIWLEWVTDLSVNDAGTVAITGYYTGDLSFGWPFPTAGWSNIFVATFDTNGIHQWSAGPFGSVEADRGLGIDINNAGEVAVTGSFEATLNFGGADLTPWGEGGLSDGFLVKYDANGAHLWSRGFGYSLDDAGTGVSLDDAGNVAMTGHFNSRVYLGGPAWIFGSGYYDPFIVEYDAAGNYLWARAFANTVANTPKTTAVDFDAAGNAFMTGSFAGSMDFGGGALTSANWQSDIFLASYDATGAHLWSERFGAVGNENGLDICAVAPGQFWTTGSLGGEAVDFGGGPLPGYNGATLAYVVRFGVPQPAASITAITDVPDDEGRWVTIDFVSSEHDDLAAAEPIVSYDIYRFEPIPHAPALVGTLLATQQATYSIDVRTRTDATETIFLIHANTAGVTYYNSLSASGISYDNLAPGMPTGIAAAYQSTGTILDWDDAPEPDLQFYRVYRDPDPAFDPSPANLLQEVVVSSWNDATSNPWGYHYKISAVDIAGNEGEAGSVTVSTDVPKSGGVFAFDLHAAVPNPFNPSTTISYSIPAAGKVRLAIYNVAGREVRILVDEVQNGGTHDARWNGLDQAGNRAASGVYMYQLRSGNFVETRRMVLLK